MKKQDIKLFDASIHGLKDILGELKNQREKHNIEFMTMKADHEGEMFRLQEKAQLCLDEINQLFEHLYDNTEED